MVRPIKEVEKIAHEYALCVSKLFDDVEVRLFGSYYNGNPHKYSDIDLAVSSPDFRGMDEIIALKILNRLKLEINDEIEPLALFPEELTHPQKGSVGFAVHLGNSLIYKAPKLF